MGAGAGKHTSQFKSRMGTSRSKEAVWHGPSKSPSQSPLLWEKDAKDSTFKQGFFSQSHTDIDGISQISTSMPDIDGISQTSTSMPDIFRISQTSTSMPELLVEHLQAANLGNYIPAVSRWMDKEGVLDFAELEAIELQDLYDELGLSTKCRRLFDICLGLSLEVLVKRQSAY